MDFNDIEKIWKNDKDSEVSLPSNLDAIASTHTPLARIRKNLKYELITQVVSVVLIGFLPILYQFSNDLTSVFYLLYLPFTAICAYFLLKLYQFYKRINQPQLNTKDSLYETYYDILLNIQLYKSFTYSLVPFVLVFVGMIMLHNFDGVLTEFLNPEKNKKAISFAIGFFIGMTVSIGFVTEWWVHTFYGKYAKEIRKVLDELKE